MHSSSDEHHRLGHILNKKGIMAQSYRIMKNEKKIQLYNQISEDEPEN